MLFSRTRSSFGILLLCLNLPAVAADAPPAPPASQPYTWHSVAMGGGGFVDGLVFHPAAPDLLYCRTDVGGAYRWDASAQTWIPLLDWLGPDQVNFTGIESIGLDPSNPDRLYLAAGTYRFGDAAILRSNDRGKTFEIFKVPFRMGGNDDGRANGERLAVDPNLGSIVFFGSRAAGLWQSTDSGATWKSIDSFSNTGAERQGDQRGFDRGTAYGIVSIVFDPASGHHGSPTPVIYAAVSAPGTNIYRSTNAGATWQPVAGQPADLRPNHLVLATDGTLFVSYSSVPGPNNATDGAVWKFSPASGMWFNITPEVPGGDGGPGWGYGAVCVDAHHPETVMVSSIDQWRNHDEVYRTTNGGATWQGILRNGHMDNSPGPYSSRITPHWLAGLAVNPNNSDQIWFGTGYGVWQSLNATAADSGQPVNWLFADRGLEETVPFALISPPAGPHLLSGVADVDGFRHDDVSVSPAEGNFPGPRFSNTRALAYAGLKPNIIVRIGPSGRVPVHIAISDDGGGNWTSLARNAPGGGGNQGDTIALSADGVIIVWKPNNRAPSLTTDRGLTWTNCAGLGSGDVVIADTVNPLRFYALQPHTGHIFISTNAAASFQPIASSLPAIPRFGARSGGVFTATTGIEGDLWAGSRETGLFHSTDGGNSFTKLDNVACADALGFGKAAPGQTYPTLYFLGTINQLQARFRSDDAGRTWVRIDDDQHRYAIADVPVIIGDPRIYGRVYFTTGGRGVIYGDPSK